MMTLRPCSCARRKSRSRLANENAPSRGSAVAQSTQVFTVLKPAALIASRSLPHRSALVASNRSCIGARAFPPPYHTATGKKAPPDRSFCSPWTTAPRQAESQRHKEQHRQCAQTSWKNPPAPHIRFRAKCLFSWAELSRVSAHAGGRPRRSKEPSTTAPRRSGPRYEHSEAVARAGRWRRPRPEKGQKTKNHSSRVVSSAWLSNRATSRLGRGQIQPVKLRGATSTFRVRLLGLRDTVACPGGGQNNPAANELGAARQPPVPCEGRGAIKNTPRRAKSPTPTAAAGYARWDRR